MTLEKKLLNDEKTIIDFINNSPNKKNIIAMFKKGPPDSGFMWCDKEGGPGKYWTEEEALGLKELTNLVLKLGWESSGYSIMLRKIQSQYIECD